MMLLRVSLAVVLLLASVGTASAECAWVLWREITVSAFDANGREDPDAAQHSWDIVAATPDNQLCLKAVAAKLKEWAAQTKPMPEIPGYPRLQSTTQVGGNTVTTTSRRPDTGAVAFVGQTRLLCLPDTIDPRGPKGK
jgi:hypothetical protein